MDRLTHSDRGKQHRQENPNKASASVPHRTSLRISHAIGQP
ncbi:hypothetical protein OP10G_1367 [Fimbriimonas ginsengisoli Gsoil 348]|uniref:Uncharacterized protein n=1 Tax=Fimbriimonas ginsengisoli Gsoil 348 TaxID=661478 RepID=A0A068NPQ0_FIMGI|nr:hypothetical protein OP10G_1367 [Fimbriimonas ginsengisoli Gsoil 348]